MSVKNLDVTQVFREGWCKVDDQNILTNLNSCDSVLAPWGRNIRLKFLEDNSSCHKRLELTRS